MKVGDKVFVYGTLKTGYGANGNMQRGAKFLGEARIPGRIYEVSWFPGVKLTTEDPEKDVVHGEVYEITDAALPAALDRYEGYPTLYTREVVKTAEGDEVWVYVINRDMPEDSRIVSGKWEG